jgi:nucleotide-binding universal stress UspA family protein
MKNILVPIDFSDVSGNALKFAVKIAQPLKSKIILFHSIQPILIANDMGGFIYPDTNDEEVSLDIDRKLSGLLDFVNDHNVIADKIVQRGVLLGDEIKYLVEKENIEMIITGTHGAKGLEAFFFGTNSVNIFETVKCPVLIVPSTAKYHSIKKIMYATDFQYGDIQEIEKICKLAEPLNAQIIVTHINSDPQKSAKEEDLMDWFAEIGDTNISYKNIVYKLIYNQNVETAIENAVTVLDVDMVCMSTAEKDFFKKLVSKSNIKSMAFHTKIPLMALHLNAENKLI